MDAAVCHAVSNASLMLPGVVHSCLCNKFSTEMVTVTIAGSLLARSAESVQIEPVSFSSMQLQHKVQASKIELGQVCSGSLQQTISCPHFNSSTAMVTQQAYINQPS